MIKAAIFGGTTEGRRLCQLCADIGIPILYFIATEDGARLVENLPNINARIGRLNADEMCASLEKSNPVLVIDATHPYATEASKNISDACRRIGVQLVRVIRCKPESQTEADCVFFNNKDSLISWLEQERGNIFVTTGSSSAVMLTKLTDYQNRIWMRVLPNISSLCACLDLAYRPERLICMQGPFSEELNRAMFQSTKARILVTKDTGVAGGFPEKLRAAQGLGMVTAVLSKPEETGGVTLEDACKLLMELSI